jgi:diguanylate cyclase (GGDEF)-like protein/PAS domain S-box-containing protein
MPKPTIRVLLTEDVPADAELEVRELKRAGLRIVHHTVDTQDAFERAVHEFSPDIILSDFSMPSFDGMAALSLARDLCPDVPFIFVSGTIGEEYAIRALKNGATDYVLKSNLVRLPAAVERALADARERREKRKAEAELDLARERLTSIFASVPDVLWSVDVQTDEVLYVSPAAAEVLGRDAQEFLLDAGLWKRLIHPDDAGGVLAAWQAAHAGSPFEIEYRIRHPERGERWVNARGRLVREAGRIDGVARDVTERVWQNERLLRLSRVRNLASAVNAAIVRIRERQPLFEEFCRIAVNQGGFRAARLVDFDSDGKLRRAVSGGVGDALLHDVIDSINRDGAGAAGLLAEALRSGRPVVSNDVTADERAMLRSHYGPAGINSVACLPLVVDGKVAGAVVLDAGEPGFFDDDELRVLESLTANVSFALELMAKQERIAYLALYDSLTGLANRTLFHERLTQAMEAAARADARLALVVTDLDRFKAINDTLGRVAGDALLKAVAQRLRQAAGDAGQVGRVGANSFALMFPNIPNAEVVARGLERANVFGEPFQIEGHEVRITARTGIAVSPDDGADADALFRNAEAALKSAKETGERYLFYAPSINARVAEQVGLEHNLRRAVEKGELFLHFQPKVDLANGAIVGLEALMRWKGPDGNLVSPAKFVPVLEQTGLIFEAGQQVLAAAKRQHADWRARGLKAPRIAVNVSALQLRRRSFVEDVRQALGEVGADGGGVDIEITESLLMTEVEESIRKLRALRELGLHLALDDFGTGYSSLAYLGKLPLDVIKIDRSFVNGMTDNADHTSIISAIISLAHALRLKVVAEGVETEPQAQLLRLLRCEQAQGYLFSRPLAADAIEEKLKAL